MLTLVIRRNHGVLVAIVEPDASIFVYSHSTMKTENNEFDKKQTEN